MELWINILSFSKESFERVIVKDCLKYFIQGYTGSFTANYTCPGKVRDLHIDAFTEPCLVNALMWHWRYVQAMLYFKIKLLIISIWLFIVSIWLMYSGMQLAVFTHIYILRHGKRVSENHVYVAFFVVFNCNIDQRQFQHLHSTRWKHKQPIPVTWQMGYHSSLPQRADNRAQSMLEHSGTITGIKVFISSGYSFPQCCSASGG